jgi:hypothetical protein
MTEEPIISIRIDSDLSQYRPFFDHLWTDQIDGMAAGTKLAEQVSTLCVNWRAAANTCAMPWLMCQASQRQWVGFLKRQQPFSQRLTGAVVDRVGDAMGGSLSKAKQKKLAQVVEQIGSEMHRQADEAQQFTAEAVWTTLLEDPEFQLAVWGSQRIGYGSIYHAYEHFVRDCIALVKGNPEYRGRRIHALVRDAGRLFGSKIAQDCLASPPVKTARLVRNTLAHNGGRETPQLRDHPHGLVVEEGVLQILASDTRGLFDLLKGRAYQLIRKAVTLPGAATETAE